MSGEGRRSREHEDRTGETLEQERHTTLERRGGREGRREASAVAEESWGKYGGDDGALEHEGAEAHTVEGAGSETSDKRTGAGEVSPT